MGGNVFEGAVRITSVEMEELRNELSYFLRVNNIPHYFIKSVSEKKDHGDIDVLVDCDFGQLTAKLSFNYPTSRSGDCLSHLYRGKYQVDFIKSKIHEFKIAALFYDFNDFGNIIGRILKWNGYKLTPHGLYYTYRDDNFKTDILLSLDITSVFEILQLDINPYMYCFDTFEQMFEFVASCPSFGTEPYQFENLTANNRIRDRKRKTYLKFLDWCNSHPELPKEPNICLVKPADKFPELVNAIKILDIEQTRKKEFKKSFNGNIIAELTGLAGKELGQFMKQLTDNYTEDQLKSDLSDIVKNEMAKLNIV